jgi:hypothetical protein
MADNNDFRPVPRGGQEVPNDPTFRDESLHAEWDKEASRTIDESALRGRPEWIEAIGDEDEDQDRIEQDLQDYGWDLLGEDDFVSNPTSEADMPTWLSDDYDDEYLKHLEEQQDELTSGGDTRDDDGFYSD